MNNTFSRFSWPVLGIAFAVLVALVALADTLGAIHLTHMGPEGPAMAGMAGIGLSRKNAGGDSEDPVDVSAALAKIGEQVKDFAEQAKKAHGKLSEEFKAKVDEALAKQGELDARLKEIEQKALRRGGEEETRKSIGEKFVELDAVKEMMGRRKGRASMDLKAITSAVGSGGALVDPQRIATPIMLPDRRMTVRDLITPGTTGSNAIEYVRETGFTNSADVVSEGVLKPESNITFELITDSVSTIAHWLPASKQILDDAPMLASYIDGRLRYGLMFKEELQLLKGSGVGQNLEGLVTAATAYSAPITISGATMIDVLRLALLQAELAEYPSTGIVLHPSDWARIELTKDTQGRYIFANPTAQNQPGMWGRPVVATQSMDEDEFLVGAFRLGAQIFDREQANVEISTEDQDNFVKNMVTIRAEERLAMAIYRPEAFVTGDFGNITG